MNGAYWSIEKKGKRVFEVCRDQRIWIYSVTPVLPRKQSMQRRFAFTDARVKVLPPAAKGQRDVYCDSKQPGLTVRVTANGAKTYCVHRRIRGSRLVRENIGRSPDISVEDARAKAAVVVVQIATAEDPGAARRALRAEPTLAQLFQRYMEDRAKSGKRRTADVLSMWQLYLGAMPDEPWKSHGRKRVKPDIGVDWSARKISEITAEQVSVLHTRIVNAGKPTAANRVHELLRPSTAMQSRTNSSSPILRIQLPQRRKGIDRDFWARMSFRDSRQR